jgi:hypothetical protein
MDNILSPIHVYGAVNFLSEVIQLFFVIGIWYSDQGTQLC